MTGKKFLDVILEVDRHAMNTPADVRNMVEHDRRVDLNEIGHKGPRRYRARALRQFPQYVPPSPKGFPTGSSQSPMRVGFGS